MAHTIEIDFEVFKALTARRATEAVSYNDVIRELLGFAGKSGPSNTSSIRAGSDGDWIYKGVRFPTGTEFRASYKGVSHSAKVENGSMVLNGQAVGSPSIAAKIVTNTNVNGWIFWEYRFPGESRWQLLKSLRPNR